MERKFLNEILKIVDQKSELLNEFITSESKTSY